MTTSSFSRPTSNVSGLVYANYIPTIALTSTTSAFTSNNVGYVNVSSEEDFSKENFTDEEWVQFKKDVNLEDY